MKNLIILPLALATGQSKASDFNHNTDSPPKIYFSLQDNSVLNQEITQFELIELIELGNIEKLIITQEYKEGSDIITATAKWVIDPNIKNYTNKNSTWTEPRITKKNSNPQNASAWTEPKDNKLSDLDTSNGIPKSIKSPMPELPEKTTINEEQE